MIGEVRPFVTAIVASVIHYQESALQQVSAKAGDFFFSGIPATDFNDVRDGILEDFRVIQAEDVGALSLRIDEGCLLDDAEKVAFSPGIVVCPSRLTSTEEP